MTDTITVQIKNVYGNRTIYPACEVAKLFVLLTGKKTFSDADIRTIKDLGYAVNIASEVAPRGWDSVQS